MKNILHLCADLGSDSRFYQLDKNYNVIMVGKEIGVENYTPPENVYGIIANPVCTEFSNFKNFSEKGGNHTLGMKMVNDCISIINRCKKQGGLKFWVIENPANGGLKKYLGKPKITYQPWRYGSPWTKNTALWGEFNIPEAIYDKWEDVPKIEGLYIRPNRSKPSLAFLHKSAVDLIPEMKWAKEYIKSDADIRSMCSQGFAKAFFESNK
jgi:hypothetical protein